MSLSDYFFTQGINLLKSEDISEKREGIENLSRVTDRRAYTPLMEMLQDDKLAPEVVLTLAKLGDSRCLFPLINIFYSTDNPGMKQRILQYMSHTGDPRAIDFLQEYTPDRSNLFLDVANNALIACNSTVEFPYRFAGTEEMYRNALTVSGQIPLANDSLTRSAEIIAQNSQGFSYERPQTYVVLTDGQMLIGGIINEHVEVARGKDVLAAGEIKLQQRSSGSWEVEEINNRSNGYYPSPRSFIHVARFFQKSDVHFDRDSFDVTYPTNGFNDPDFLSLFKYN